MNRCDLADYLQQQHEQHCYRQRHVVQGPQGTQLTINQKSYLNFCSNDYLGLANHPQVVEAFNQGARLYGVGSGASHLINGHSEAHHRLELALAEFVGRPRALLFSTGYMANLGVISSLMARGDTVFEDRLNHASLLDGGLLSQARLQRYQHNDLTDLEHKLSQSKAKTKLICSDGVFSMDGDIAPVADLSALAKQHQAWLMIDDAHGLGVLGEHGKGCMSLFDLSCEEVPILVGTFGKALGTFGAFVAGSENLIETLIQRARSYIYTTALPAAIAEATRVSLKVMQAETWRRETLTEHIAYFKQCATTAGLPVTDSNSAIQPIMIGDVAKTVELSQQLHQAGIMVSAIRPPTVPEGTARLRVTLSAEHTRQQIQQLVTQIAACLNN